MCNHDDGCNAPEGECSGACMTQGETLDQLCERYPAVKALQNSRDIALQDYVEASHALNVLREKYADAIIRSDSLQLGIDAFAVTEQQDKERIAALESQLAELRQGGEAVAVAEEVRKSLADKYQQGIDTNSADMGGNCDWARLEGAVKVVQALRTSRPQPAIPPGYAAAHSYLLAKFIKRMNRHRRSNVWMYDKAIEVLRDLLSAAPSVPVVEKDAKDSQRLDFITTFGLPWSVQWMKVGKNNVKFRMLDDGEPWGGWHPTARAAIDDAMLAASADSKEGEK